MRKAWLALGLFGLVGCGAYQSDLTPDTKYKIAETYEYRYTQGNHFDDHRNLQWRMEQIEKKIDALTKK